MVGDISNERIIHTVIPTLNVNLVKEGNGIPLFLQRDMEINVNLLNRFLNRLAMNEINIDGLLLYA